MCFLFLIIWTLSGAWYIRNYIYCFNVCSMLIWITKFANRVYEKYPYWKYWTINYLFDLQKNFILICEIKHIQQFYHNTCLKNIQSILKLLYWHICSIQSVYMSSFSVILYIAIWIWLSFKVLILMFRKEMIRKVRVPLFWWS